MILFSKKYNISIKLQILHFVFIKQKCIDFNLKKYKIMYINNVKIK